MAEGKHLGAELRIGARADQYEVSNEADELVAEAEKHAGGSCPIAPTIHGRDSQLGPGGVTPGPAPGVPIELTPHRLRHTCKADREAVLMPRPVRVINRVCGGEVTLRLAGMDPAECRDCGAWFDQRSGNMLPVREGFEIPTVRSSS